MIVSCGCDAAIIRRLIKKITKGIYSPAPRTYSCHIEAQNTAQASTTGHRSLTTRRLAAVSGPDHTLGGIGKD